MNSRFVILTHDHPRLHWDLMLEEAQSLRTWRLLAEPGSQNPIPAEALPSHRKHYLTYEGPVSGDRGTVSQWDSGTYRLLQEDEHHLRVRLDGARLRTTMVIRRIDEEQDEGRWQVQFESSEAASD
jgi:hypothetical protein